MIYRVTWEIDIDAETAQDAAARALEIQRNPQSQATFFVVRSEVTVDLDLEEEA